MAPRARGRCAAQDRGARHLQARDVGQRAGRPGEAIKTHGKPALFVSDHGIRSCASEPDARGRGRTGSGRRLADFGIRPVLARVGHHPTDGEIERFREATWRHLAGSGAESAGASTRSAPAGPAPASGSFHQGGPAMPWRGWPGGAARTGPACSPAGARRPQWPTSARCPRAKDYGRAVRIVYEAKYGWQTMDRTRLET